MSKIYKELTAGKEIARLLEAEALNMLPTQVKNYVNALVQDENISPDFAIKSIVHMLGGLAQAKHVIEVSNWRTNTATLTLLIGPPSANKNLAKHFRNLEAVKSLEKHVSEIKIDVGKNKDGKTTTMVASQFITGGSSQAVQRMVVAGLPYGVMWVVDEMLHLVMHFTDARSDKGQHSLELLKLMFEAGKISDHKKTVTSDVGQLFGTFLGNIQPQLWAKLLSHIRTLDTGTLQRFVYLESDSTTPRRVRKLAKTVVDEMEDYTRRYVDYLNQIDGQTIVETYDEDVFTGYHLHLQKLAEKAEDERTANYILKQNYYVLKYALMHHVLQMREGVLKRDSFLFAIKMVQANIFRFRHLIAKKPGDSSAYRRRLARAFYDEFKPERNLTMKWMQEATGIPTSTLSDTKNPGWS